MSFDWYAAHPVNTLADVDMICQGTGTLGPDTDISSRIELLAGALHKNEKEEFITAKKKPKRIAIKAYAASGDDDKSPNCGLKPLLHDVTSINEALANSRQLMASLGIAAAPALPSGISDWWFLTFGFTLRKPFISKDDCPFYIIENPALKERVFRVPMIAETTWKGNLRWATMKTILENGRLSDDEFVKARVRLALLFGTEQGSEEDGCKGFADYLDRLRPECATDYRKLLADHFKRKHGELIHHRGRLRFYPTFFDRLDMGIINPHHRSTGAGSVPVQIEWVPGSDDKAKSATGTFSLLYFPFDRIGQDTQRRESLQSLLDVYRGLEQLMGVYGFSAKKSSGFGVIHKELDRGGLRLGGQEQPIRFVSFKELSDRVLALWKSI